MWYLHQRNENGIVVEYYSIVGSKQDGRMVGVCGNRAPVIVFVVSCDFAHKYTSYCVLP